MAKDAIEGYLETMRDHRWSVPATVHERVVTKAVCATSFRLSSHESLSARSKRLAGNWTALAAASDILIHSAIRKAVPVPVIAAVEV